jgi:hypothetical protein
VSEWRPKARHLARHMAHEKAAVAFLVAASFVLFCLYGLATPLFETSDELWHYPLVQHLATTASLPVQRSDQTDADAPWRQEGSQPPLYYAIAALATAPFDSSNWRDIRRLNPHSDMGVPTRDGNANAVLHTPAEDFPWTGAALAVRIARLVSIVLSTLTVLFAYLVACELFPDDGGRTTDDGDEPIRDSSIVNRQSPQSSNVGLRLGTMVFTACVPMFAFISGSVNNDNAAALFATMGVWWALRVARRGDLSVRSGLVAGLITSAAILSKSSAAGLVGLFGLAALLSRQPPVVSSQTVPAGRHPSFAILLSIFVVVLVSVVAVLTGWWFARNQVLYGDLLGWNAFLDAVGRRLPPASLAQLWSEREGFVWAYWGVFGTLNIILPPTVYDALNGMVLAALAGAGWAAVKKITEHRAQSADKTRPGLALVRRPSSVVHLWSFVVGHSSFVICMAWVAVTFVALLRWTSLTPASQGRLMFPCIAVIAAGIAYGFSRIHRVALWFGGAGLAVLAFAVPFAVIAPVYARPPALAQPAPSHPLGVMLGNALELVGYDEPSAATAAPGDEPMLRLYWRLRAPLARNYSVFVHLVDEDNVIVAQRDMYPGQGTLATSELQPGYAWSDRYALRIPRLAPAPKRLHMDAGMYDLQTGERLTVTAEPGAEQSVAFGQLDLLPGSTGDPLLRYANGIELTGYDLQPRSLTAQTPLSVTLHWRAASRIGSDYTISLQLLDDKANKIAQHDSAPAGGDAPTSSWAVGTAITDTHVLHIAPDAPPGVYRLLLVWYLPTDFSRLGAYDGHTGQYTGDEIELTRLRVK